MANSYKVGDTVKLKAGGPDMSISRILYKDRPDDTTYECQWFAGKKLESGYFPPQSLVLVDKEAT